MHACGVASPLSSTKRSDYPRHLNALFRDHISYGRHDSRPEFSRQELIAAAAPVERHGARCGQGRDDVKWTNAVLRSAAYRFSKLRYGVVLGGDSPPTRGVWVADPRGLTIRCPNPLLSPTDTCLGTLAVACPPKAMHRWFDTVSSPTVGQISAQMREFFRQWREMSEFERSARSVRVWLPIAPPLGAHKQRTRRMIPRTKPCLV